MTTQEWVQKNADQVNAVIDRYILKFGRRPQAVIFSLPPPKGYSNDSPMKFNDVNVYFYVEPMFVSLLFAASDGDNLINVPWTPVDRTGFANIVCTFGQATPVHAHKPKKYIGFTDTFMYCEDCGDKL